MNEKTKPIPFKYTRDPSAVDLILLHNFYFFLLNKIYIKEKREYILQGAYPRKIQKRTVAQQSIKKETYDRLSKHVRYRALKLSRLSINSVQKANQHTILMQPFLKFC